MTSYLHHEVTGVDIAERRWKKRELRINSRGAHFVLFYDGCDTDRNGVVMTGQLMNDFRTLEQIHVTTKFSAVDIRTLPLIFNVEQCSATTPTVVMYKGGKRHERMYSSMNVTQFVENGISVNTTEVPPPYVEGV